MNRREMVKRFLIAAVLGFAVAGCRHSSSEGVVFARTASSLQASPGQSLNALDDRIPVPLLPRMALHQRENMRDHLAAVQEILAAVLAGDFENAERSAGRIGYTEEMGQMCAHMGAGAPSFNELALNFHRTADTITAAAKARDRAATLKAVSTTLQTCVSCHAVYRQQIVDEATWKAITSRPTANLSRP